MKAVRNALPEVVVEQIDVPTGDGVLVKVASATICASDLMYQKWGSQQIAGHEFAGLTEDGTPVAIEAFLGCGNCEYCAEGSLNLCATAFTASLGFTLPGGMSEYFLAPAHSVRPLPSGLDVADGGLVEPGSVAWHGARKGGASAATRVAVVGGGAIGILAAAAAMELGATDVAVEARHPHQIAARELIGATEPKGLYDVVLETAGSDTSLHRAIELVRPRGTVVYMGFFDEAMKWPMLAAFAKEAAIVPSLGYCASGERREFDEVAAMLARRPELARTLITHRFPIDDAAEAFRVAQDKSKGVFRVCIDPRG